MPAYYTAILMESEEVKWSLKANLNVPDAGPDDQRLIIEFEGDLARMPWAANLSGGNVTLDFNQLVDCAPAFFDKAWLRNLGSRQAGVATMGHHYIIDLQL
jgi:hypothetical protein